MTIDIDHAFISKHFIPLLNCVRGIDSAWLLEKNLSNPSEGNAGILLVFLAPWSPFGTSIVVGNLFEKCIEGTDLESRLLLRFLPPRAEGETQPAKLPAGVWRSLYKRKAEERGDR